jgi:hypothetical protein
MIGVKHTKKPHTLGTKLSKAIIGLGNKTLPYTQASAGTLAKGLGTVLGLGINNLLPNSSNTAELQYMPMGMLKQHRNKKSYLEKR